MDSNIVHLSSMGSDKARASVEEGFGDGSFIELPIIDSIGREQNVPFVFEFGATFHVENGVATWDILKPKAD